MKIERFEVIDKCLYWKEEKVLVVGDLHLGFEDSLKRGGIYVPLEQQKETMKNLEKVLEKVGKLKKVILLGDVRHNFARIMSGERKDFDDLVGLISKRLVVGGEIIITKGNHDTILKSIVRDYKTINLVDYFVWKGVLFFHGDKKSLINAKLKKAEKGIEIIVNGHFHPAVILKGKGDIRKEKYKCFVFFNNKKKKELIVPSFFPLNEGYSVLENQDLSQNDLKKGIIYALDEKGEVYRFSGKSLF